MNDDHEPQTVILDDRIDISQRLDDLKLWLAEYQSLDDTLRERFFELEQDKQSTLDRKAQRLIEQKQAHIGMLRRRYRVLRVKAPYEINSKVVQEQGVKRIRENLVLQYVKMTKEEKLRWLENLSFLMTPDIRILYDKITKIRRSTERGEQRNMLLGGDSGIGKVRRTTA